MLKTEIRPYQLKHVQKALRYPGFGFFGEQRSGKTLPSLAVVDQRKPDILVIVCPLKAIKVWRKQIKEHLQIDWKCTIYTVHYEAFSRSKQDRARWRRYYRKWRDQGKTVFTIVDEAHRIKKRGSYQSRMVRSITPYSTWRLALTGTPIAQGREDAWAIFDFIMPGVLGERYDAFENEYLEMGTRRGKGGREYRAIQGYKNDEKFNEIFHRYSARITLREAQREAGRAAYRVRKRVVKVELTPGTRRIYNELSEKLETVVRRRKVNTPMVLTLVSKLQQIVGGYIIHTETLRDEEGLPILTSRGNPKKSKTIIPIGREKIVELVRLLEEYPRRKKLVICVQYRHEIDRIARRLERLGRTYKILAGGIPFDGIFDVDTVILQIRSGEAVDLGDADTYIFYSWNYSYINFEQSRFRILKFTSRQANYIFLVGKDTVDEDIYEAVVQKKNLAELICDKYRRKRESSKRRRVHETVEARRGDRKRTSKASSLSPDRAQTTAC